MNLDLAGDVAFGVGFSCGVTGRWQLMNLWYMATSLSWYLEAAAGHDRLGEVVNAAIFTLYAWRWWKGGGGDNTKRRLRRLARKFTPTRRTAPAAT